MKILLKQIFIVILPALFLFHVWAFATTEIVPSDIYDAPRVNPHRDTLSSIPNDYIEYDGNLRFTTIAPPGVNATTFTYPDDNSYKDETRSRFVSRFSLTKKQIHIVFQII